MTHVGPDALVWAGEERLPKSLLNEELIRWKSSELGRKLINVRLVSGQVFRPADSTLSCDLSFRPRLDDSRSESSCEWRNLLEMALSA
jgi:hypothetical protein